MGDIMTGLPILSVLVLLPLAGAICLLPMKNRPDMARAFALTLGLLEILLAFACLRFTSAPIPPGLPGGFFLYENLPWIESLGIRYILGMDSISLLLVILTSILTLIAMLVSRGSITQRVTMHYLLLLLIQSGVMGVFLSLDLFLFYLFWEVMLIPMFFLIGIWGDEQRIYSTVKLFLYTITGSLLMLLAIIGIYLIHGSQSGTYTFALTALTGTVIPPATGLWLCSAFLLAFAVKFPLVPLHTWQPDAYTSAPTSGSIMLAGLLSKTGAYGLIRFGYPLFPDAARMLMPLVVTLAVTGILYASWIAFAQKDMKRLIAYSSVAHMGFIALGIAVWSPIALSGAIMQLINHGLTTSALFVMTGILEERANTRQIESFGGLWGKVPLFSAFFMLFAMASAGLPGLNNFVGEFLILTGSFKVAPVAAALAFIGVILPLIYTVRLIQKTIFEGERSRLTLTDLNASELFLLTSLMLAGLYLGLHPEPLLNLLEIPVGLLTGGAQ